ncbi:CoA pyrophosphatase [Hyphobacterium sp. CCMP332]|uniref:CoA pyrophosphatase n=1 Tax=Hyphobacterium sp. CCMP332 TaxID=2749086 RepID=UPI0016502C3F|nr:CoA pyrophosphatase [Hyphobacterium sp. CCMP332]QNL18142.1 CoA pyrophosphatase [Hyphobacterium sp. CCMP332]
MTPQSILDLLDAKLDHPDRPANTAARGDGDLDGRIIPSGAQLNQAAVLAPLILHDGPPRFLFTVRAAHLTKHAGQISFPGGRREPGETLAQTALRETQEEIGIGPEYIDILGCFDPYETVTAYQVTPFVGVVKPGYTVTPDHQEVSAVFETPFDFLMNAANHERHEMEFRGKMRRFWAMPYRDHYIWGATAGMLKALHDRLFGDTQ